MIQEILIASAILGALGLIFGIILGVSSKIFEVKKDERIQKIMEVLPCANCGGCGFSGCSAFAQAVVTGKANPSSCAVGGSACAEKVSDIMGVKTDFVKKTAHIKCDDSCDSSPVRYSYKGLESCAAALKIGGGPKSCAYGCIGIGSCVKVCDFGALSIKNNIAAVDEEKCTGCGKCAAVCPKKIIEIIPKNKKYMVLCNSKEKGSDMKEICTAGCIGCKMCVKACDYDAVTVEDNLAKINIDKCVGCGKCAEKCPRKIIHMV